MRDVTKIPHGKNQESVSSPCWQQIADALHDYQLMIDGAKDSLWMYNISSDRYVVSQKDRERFDFDPHMRCTLCKRGKAYSIRMMRPRQ